MLNVLRSLGWQFMSRAEMNTLRGPARMNEGIVEPLLVRGIRKLNPQLEESAACEVAALVRRISSDREMLDALRDGVPYKPAPDQQTIAVSIVDTRDPSRNSYVVTEEFALQTGGVREPRLDVVCLVNGLPLGAVENKDTEEPLESAADDWRGYWLDVPQLVAQVSLSACCNGLQFRIGPSGVDELERYHHWPDPWPHAVDDPQDEMMAGLTGSFSPHALVDLAANFILFETRDGTTQKKLARSHQHRAASKIVERVLDGVLDRGIVWHATGSGKSLTMVFAARKLQRVGLGDPTVLLVIDRVELDEQISETLVACEFDGVQRPATRKELGALLRRGGGGVVVVTAQKFDATMAGLLDRGETIAFVDEAHRTQFGDFGVFMRSAIPGAKLFGFTGTPIEHGSGRSTRKAFSPTLPDGSYENYLDRYGFDQAIADGATVPIIYEPRLAKWRLSRTDLDARFDELTVGLGEAEREALRIQGAREAVIAKAPERVAAVALDVAQQLKVHTGPSGFAGLFVAVDREACALVAEALSDHLQPDEFAVAMSRSKKDNAPRPGQADLRHWYPAIAWERVYGRPPEPTGDEGKSGDLSEGIVSDEYFASGDRAAIKDYVRRIKREHDSFKLLVVNAMLLTGFDAPRLQTVFLDRGLRSHTLMQAMSRANRRYPEKDAGLMLDYWGAFDDLQAALEEFAANDLAGLAEDCDALIARLPVILDEALSIASGAPTQSARKRMLWLVRHLADRPEQAERFRGLVRQAQSIYETLAPDPRLLPYMSRYREVVESWSVWLRGTRRDRRENAGLRHKTRLLVQQSIGMEGVRNELPAATISADYLRALREDDSLSLEEKATDIEAAVVHEVKVRSPDDPRVQALAERLAELRRRRERQAQITVERLREWERLVADYVAEAAKTHGLGLDEPGALTHAVLRRAAAAAADDQLVAVAHAISDAYASTAGFEGWSERTDVVQGLRRAVVAALVEQPDTRQLARDPQVTDSLIAALMTADRRRV